MRMATINNFNDARNYLLAHPPRWCLYIPQQYAGYDREGELGATNNASQRKNYAFPYDELAYYDYIIDGRTWLDRMRQRYARRGRRPPTTQRWLHYILPYLRCDVSACASAAPNSGTPRSFRDGNLFQMFPTVSGSPEGFWERRTAWGGNLAFRQAADSNHIAYQCWDPNWGERNYLIRWLDMPQSFWNEVLSNLCARSGSDFPCCTQNITGIYVDSWNSWFNIVRGGSAQGGTATPILTADRYSNSQAHEAYRQFVHQLRYILRELDAARENRPSNYVPEVCTNTYAAFHLQVSDNPNAYTDPYVIPDDAYLDRAYYINRNSAGYELYTNPDRRTDSILIEEWWWALHETETISGSGQSGIYKSKQTGWYNRDARILLALRHGITVHLQVPHAVSKNDYELKVIQIAKFWSQYRTQFPNQIYFVERNHREVPRLPNTSTRINFVPYNGNPNDPRAGYPQPVSRLLRWNYDADPRFRPIKLTLNDGEAQ